MTSGPSAINLSCSYRPRRVQSAPVCGCSFVECSSALPRRATLSPRDIVRVICSPRPCAAAASSECSFAPLRRGLSRYRSCRMQSAPVCGCGFVGVLVRTSSSRDLFFVCAPCALRMIRYNPISFRLRFVRISSQHHCLRSVPLPYPPLLSLSFRPSRPAVGHAGCLSDSSSSDEERQALALAAAPQLATCSL